MHYQTVLRDERFHRELNPDDPLDRGTSLPLDHGTVGLTMAVSAKHGALGDLGHNVISRIAVANDLRDCELLRRAVFVMEIQARRMTLGTLPASAINLVSDDLLAEFSNSRAANSLMPLRLEFGVAFWVLGRQSVGRDLNPRLPGSQPGSQPDRDPNTPAWRESNPRQHP